MRDLAVQAANSGVLDKTATVDVQKEMSQLKSQLDHIAATTMFNGTKLLDGAYLGTFQVGANVGDLLTIGIGNTQAGMDARGLGVSTVDVTTSVNIPATVVPAVSDQPGPPAAAALDTSPSAFDPTASGLTFTGDTPASGSTDAAAALLTPEYTGKSGASAAIPLIDKAVTRISMTRADMGAFEKRLDHTVDRLGVAIANTMASDSRIRDTDMAGEMANFSRQQVLSQSGSAMLAQANQTTQSILKLLSG
jgi:flagellin